MLILLLAAAAVQPPGPVDNLREIVIEAIRNCPRPIAGELVVCARDIGGAPPYRLPRLDSRFARREARTGPPGPPTAGSAGIGSCSAVGAGGGSGCALRDVDAWRERRRDRGDEGYP